MYLRASVVAAALACSLAGAVGNTVPVSAATARHCIAEASTTGDRPSMRCFPTFAAAIAAASGGRIRLAPSTRDGLLPPAAVVLDMQAVTASPATTVIIGIDYADANFSGNSLTWYQSAGCGDYFASSMPTGWNDVISSVANYSGCGTTLYQDINYGGSTYSVAVDGSASSLGTFNDQASSQKWCPADSC